MSYKHGHSVGGKRTVTWRTWSSMRERCSNINCKSYKDYGGRGIRVCLRWVKFVNFLEDMGEKPKGMTLDRINNNKGYSKGNCRWTTYRTQENNRRDNLIIRYDGSRDTLKNWCRARNVNYANVWERIRYGGWKPKRALNTPTNKPFHEYYEVGDKH